MNIGDVVRVLRNKGRVTREGWNGKGMWLALIPASTFEVQADSPMGKAAPELVGQQVGYRDHIDIFTTSGRFGPWVANSGDLLAEDWRVV